MDDDLHQLLAALASALKSRDPSSFDEILGRIVALRDPDSIAVLLSLLDDDESMDAYMFALVHVIERLDDAIYVDRLLAAMPELCPRSPRWGRILHMRILNSDSTRSAYVERFRTASPAEQGAARRILMDLCERRPEFANRVNAVLNAG